MKWSVVSTVSAIRVLTAQLIVAATMAGLCPVIAHAQDPDDENPSRTAVSEPTPAGPRIEAGPDDTVILIDDATGRVYPVPAGATVEAFLEWLDQKRRVRDDNLPDYYVSSVVLDGEVVSTGQTGNVRAVANITARINIQVLRSEAGVRVPLRLNEATLIRFDHRSAGVAAFLPTERGQGHVCVLNGSGQYQLDLSVSVPVREAGGSSRIQLSLPGSFQSSLRLIVPGAGISVPTESPDVRTRALPEAKTEILVDGPGASLDIAWDVSPQARTVETELQSQTFLTADLGPDGAVVEALQTIVVSGSVDVLEVKRPDGYSYLSMTSPTHKGVQIEDKQANPLRILLPASTSGTIELRWEFIASAANGSDSIALGGLQLAGTARPENLLGVSVAEGYRLQRIDAPSPNVEQIRVSRFRGPTDAVAGSSLSIDEAWRFHTPGAQVSYSVARIAPSFRVTPSYDLTFRETRAELAAYIDVQVFSGSLGRIPLKWSGFQSEGWQQIEVFGWRDAESENPELVNILVQAVDQPDGGVELVLEGGQTSSQGLLEIELHSSRPIATGETPLAISIPGVDVLPIPIGRLTVRNAPSIESVLEAGDGTNARLNPGPDARAASLQVPVNQRERVWELNSIDLDFRAAVSMHEQSIACESSAILRVSQDDIRVEQSLRYSVSYAPLAAVRVMVPLSVISAQNAVFQLRVPGQSAESDRELTPLSTGLDDDAAREFRLALPEDMWGRFEIIATHAVPLPPDTTATIRPEIPLVQSSDAVAEVTRLEVVRTSSIDVQPAAAAWKNELLPGSANSWVADAAPRSVPLDVTINAGQATERFAIQRAALRSVMHPSGVRMEAVYLVTGRPGSLDIRLPQEADMDSLNVWWNGSPASVTPGRRPDESTRDIRVTPAEYDDADDNVLTLRYQMPLASGFAAFNDFRLHAPEFASDVWVAETLWVIALPLDHHVFVYPENYAPAFQWIRDGLVWSRQSRDGAASTAEWFRTSQDGRADRPVTAASDPSDNDVLRFPIDPLRPVADAHTYRFTGFGHQSSLTVRTLSVPAIALLGTGVSLVIGFVLLRLPVTRNLLSFIILAFAMALAGLWQLEAVQLLIQPAVFGLCLAGVASIIDGWRKRDTPAEALTHSAPADFLPSGPGSSHIDLHQEASDPSEPAVV